MLTDPSSVMLNLLLLMFGLAILGEPLRILIARISGLFERLDILQILVINVYLGGLLLYAIALIPLHLFRPIVLWIVLTLSAFFTIIYHSKRLIRDRRTLSIQWSDVFYCFTVFAIFLVILWMGVVPTTNFTLGSVHDSSLFALFSKVILENQQIPQTLAPYLSEGIIYPQGFFTVLSFAHIFLEIPLAEIVLYTTPLFQALIVLAAYYLGKELSGKKLGLSLAFIFAFVSRWPRLLTWGSNAFINGFALYFVSLSLIPYVLRTISRKCGKFEVIRLSIIGLLYGYLAAIHFTLFGVLLFAILVDGLARVFRSNDKKALAYRMSKNFLYIFMISLVPISIFVYRAIKWYHYPGHNFGLPSDVVVTPFPFFDIINWLLVSEGISPYMPATVEIIILIMISVISVLAYKLRWQAYGITKPLEVVSVSIAGALLQFLLCIVQYALPSIGLFAGEATKPIILVFVSLLILMGILNVIIYHNFSDHVKNVKKIAKHHIRLNKRAFLVNFKALMIIAQIFLPIYTPFVYFTIAHDTEYLTGQYDMFCVTTKDDVELMHWMSNGIPENANILISPFETGSFIPVVSGVKEVTYPFTGSRNSKAYQTFGTLVCQCVLNVTTFELIEEMNGSYIFTGSRAAYGCTQWDAALFLGNPNFKLVKRVGNSYLFKILSTDPELIFRDDFEYGNLTDEKWVFYVPKECKGNGTGYAILSSEYASHGAYSLMITAQKTRGWYYANWVYKKVRLRETANNTLSFHINSNCSSSYDFMAIIISDELWENKVYFTTPSFHLSEEMIKLSEPQGFFQFNLSRIWREKFNSNLPNLIYLEIQIADFDGIRDVGFIDYITIRA